MSTDTAYSHDWPDPEVGEVRALTGFDWDPWVLVLECDTADETATVALLDTPDDDAITPVPDGTIGQLEASTGDRDRRQAIAERIRADPDVDELHAPVSRLRPLGEPGIQDCEATPRPGGGERA